jgi:hypothetical protein
LFADAAEMLVQVKPEVLIIATTAPVHAKLTCLAAENGVKAILCEKPMATSLADAQRMIDTCAKSGTNLAINHQMRFMDQYTLPKAMLDSEQFGGVTSIHVSAGNFGLAMNGSHYFEMFRYIAGEPAAEVQAWFSADKVPNPRGPQFEDRAGSVRLVTASGVRFTLDASSDQGHGVRVSYTARHGQIFVDELGGKMNWTVRQAEHREMPTTRYGMPWEEGARDIARRMRWCLRFVFWRRFWRVKTTRQGRTVSQPCVRWSPHTFPTSNSTASSALTRRFLKPRSSLGPDSNHEHFHRLHRCRRHEPRALQSIRQPARRPVGGHPQSHARKSGRAGRRVRHPARDGQHRGTATRRRRRTCSSSPCRRCRSAASGSRPLRSRGRS